MGDSGYDLMTGYMMGANDSGVHIRFQLRAIARLPLRRLRRNVYQPRIYVGSQLDGSCTQRYESRFDDNHIYGLSSRFRHIQSLLRRALRHSLINPLVGDFSDTYRVFSSF